MQNSVSFPSSSYFQLHKINEKNMYIDLIKINDFRRTETKKSYTIHVIKFFFSGITNNEIYFLIFWKNFNFNFLNRKSFYFQILMESTNFGI